MLSVGTFAKSFDVTTVYKADTIMLVDITHDNKSSFMSLTIIQTGGY